MTYDVVKPHHEIGLIGEIPYTWAELRVRCEEHFRRSGKGPDLPFDFAEFAIGVPYTAESIEKLLYQVQAPLPMTHAATLLCMGAHVKGAEGLAWARETAERCKDYYRELDSTVKRFYNQDPERFFVVPERYAGDFDKFLKTPRGAADDELLKLVPGSVRVAGLSERSRLVAAAQLSGVLPWRNRDGFAPGYFPEEQGLPRIEDEVRRLFGNVA